MEKKTWSNQEAEAHTFLNSAQLNYRVNKMASELLHLLH